MSLALSEHLPLIASAPDGIQKLRGLILELAVRGKLVPQDLTIEPASELLKQIARERTKLEADGLCKKSKISPLVNEYETPFKLPNTWQWVRLAAVSEKLTDGSHNPPSDAGSGIPMLSSQNVHDGKIDITNPSRYLSEKDFEVENTRTKINAGDVLLTIVASIGRSAVVKKEHDRFALQRSVAVISTKLVPEFMSLQLRSPPARRYYIQHGKGTAQKGIYLGKLGEMPVAVPPVAEQHQIVAKVDELMELCDRLESEQTDSSIAHEQLVETLLGTLTQSTKSSDLAANWNRLAEHFDMLFTTESSIDILKQTIMQLAIMGKLVPQVSTDEPVSALLMRLANSSAKTKSILEVSVDEHPFAIPDSWAWGRVTTLGKTQTGTTPSKSQPSLFGTDYPFIKPGDISVAGSISYDNEGLSSEGATASGRLADPNSILMVCIGTIGKCGQIDRHCSFNQQINSVTPMEGTSDFALIALRSPYFQNEAWHRSSSTTLSILNKGKWESIPIPIPPLPEQIRIASRVDELFQKLEQLRCQITQQLALTSGLTNQLLASS